MQCKSNSGIESLQEFIKEEDESVLMCLPGYYFVKLAAVQSIPGSFMGQ